MTRASPLALWLLLPLVVGAPGPAGALKKKAEGPLAVLPFKDLNEDPQQAWMSRGIAETLVSDLKRTSKLTIVERDQLDRAMAEIDAQQGGGMSTSDAVAVGKLVGARTIVVGSYQRAGPQLRLNARFVQVETGVILDTAKVTGQVKQVFRLQDRLVAQLLDLSQGRRKKVVRRKPPPETDKTIKAYRLYAMAMTTASDAGQAKLLRDAVKEEPAFSYALDELDALEARLKAYDAEAERVLDAQAREYRKIFRDPEAEPMARWTAASKLLSYLASNGYQSARLRLGRKTYETQWPAMADLNPNARGLLHQYEAHKALRQLDQALVVGEQFLKEFPTETQRATVSGDMARLIEARRKREQLRSQIGAAQQKIDLAEAKLDYEVCETHVEQEAWEGARESCGRFLKAHRGTEGLERQLKQGAYKYLEAHLELGRFDEARTLAKRFLADHPEEAVRRAIPLRMRKWPGATLVEDAVDPARKPPGGPRAAVLPFKRQSRGRETLRLGLVLPRAISFDLDRGGRQAMVDWDRLQRDLERRPRRGREITEVADAVAVGEAVGADLIVLGSYAVEDERLLELTARKVDVKKAKVVKEVTVEGTTDEVVALQDRLLGQLFGDRFVQPDRSPPAAPPTSNRKRNPKRGYRLYNLSVTGTDTSRFGLLDEALREDPTLAYARSDYAALVLKARRGAALSTLPTARMEQALRERFGGEGLNPAQRRSEMMQFFGLLERTSHQQEILVLAARIHQMSWPTEYSDAVRANAVYWMQKAYDGLEQHHKVIEMAELYVKTFPRGHYLSVVKRNGESRETFLAKREANTEKLSEELAKIEVRRIELDGDRCETLGKHMLFLRARRHCQSFVERHQSSEIPAIVAEVKKARWVVVETHLELGEFEKARALGLAYLERHTDESWRATTIQRWPRQ